MAVKIKICGLKREIDIEYVNKYKPEYVGFVFFPPSSRYVTKDRAQELRTLLDKDITPVGVFLDNPAEEVLDIACSGAVDILQIHGKTSKEVVHEVKQKTSLPVIEAFSIETTEDVERANLSEADFVLLDHGPGGGGVTFDWTLLSGMTREYFLAGGLSPANVEEAITAVAPMAVDVSSGVETDKLKDPVKIKTFIDKVRRTQ